MTARTARGTKTRETVVLVHGLWRRELAMRVLGRRLGRCGLGFRLFRYRSRRETLQAASAALRAFVEGTAGERVHLVGHSLGGAVIARMLERPPGNLGAVALLGAPLRGSHLAMRLAQRALGRFVLGGMVLEGIVEGAPAWPPGVTPLVVAGTLPLGWGMLFGLRRPHDGLIGLEETRLPGCEVLSVRASHVGLLLSGRVASALCRFFGALPRSR